MRFSAEMGGLNNVVLVYICTRIYNAILRSADSYTPIPITSRTEDGVNRAQVSNIGAAACGATDCAHLMTAVTALPTCLIREL